MAGKLLVEDQLETQPTLSVEQVDGLLRVCESDMEELGVRLMALAGLKLGHLFSLDVADVQVNEEGAASIPESGAIDARVTLDPDSSSSILDVIGKRTSGPLLTNRAGNRMTRSNFQAILNRLAPAAKIGHRVTPNTLWKSCLANQLDSGLSVRLLGQLTRRGAHRLVTLAPRYGPDSDRDRALVRLSLGPRRQRTR